MAAMEIARAGMNKAVTSGHDRVEAILTSDGSGSNGSESDGSSSEQPQLTQPQLTQPQLVETSPKLTQKPKKKRKPNRKRKAAKLRRTAAHMKLKKMQAAEDKMNAKQKERLRREVLQDIERARDTSKSPSPPSSEERLPNEKMEVPMRRKKRRRREKA